MPGASSYSGFRIAVSLNGPQRRGLTALVVEDGCSETCDQRASRYPDRMPVDPWGNAYVFVSDRRTFSALASIAHTRVHAPINRALVARAPIAVIAVGVRGAGRERHTTAGTTHGTWMAYVERLVTRRTLEHRAAQRTSALDLNPREVRAHLIGALAARVSVRQQRWGRWRGWWIAGHPTHARAVGVRLALANRHRSAGAQHSWRTRRDDA
jgi:hypothetical protein